MEKQESPSVRQEMISRMVQSVYSLDVGRWQRFVESAAEVLAEAGHIKNQLPQKAGKRREAVQSMGFDFWYTALDQLNDKQLMDLYDRWMWANCAQR